MKGIKVYISEEADKKIRKLSMDRFGYGKGSLSKAVESAIMQWAGSISDINVTLEKLKEKAKNDHNIIAVYLFGSYADGRQYFNDIDVAFLVGDVKKFDKSGYHFNEKLDISIMEELPLNIQMRIFEKGKLLLINDNSRLLDYYFDCYEKWEDFKGTLHYAIGM